MEGIWRVLQVIEAVGHGYGALQDALARRDMISECAFLAQSLATEREEIRVLREELKTERRKAEHYWLLLYNEGFMQDEQGNIHRVDFDLDDEEEGNEETEEAILSEEG